MTEHHGSQPETTTSDTQWPPERPITTKPPQHVLDALDPQRATALAKHPVILWREFVREMADARVTGSVVGVAALMADRIGMGFVKLPEERIVADTHYGPDSTRSALGVLVELGLLARRQPSRRSAYEYALTWPHVALQVRRVPGSAGVSVPGSAGVSAASDTRVPGSAGVSVPGSAGVLMSTSEQEQERALSQPSAHSDNSAPPPRQTSPSGSRKPRPPSDAKVACFKARYRAAHPGEQPPDVTGWTDRQMNAAIDGLPEPKRATSAPDNPQWTILNLSPSRCDCGACWTCEERAEMDASVAACLASARKGPPLTLGSRGRATDPGVGA